MVWVWILEKPLADNLKKIDDGGKVRSLTYEFQQSPKDIDAAISKLLLGESYKRSELLSNRYDLDVRYKKVSIYGCSQI